MNMIRDIVEHRVTQYDQVLGNIGLEMIIIIILIYKNDRVRRIFEDVWI